MFLFAHPLHAGKVSKTTVIFLLLTQSVSVLIVERAGAAFSFGASLIFYNPASLAKSKGVMQHLFTLHTLWIHPLAMLDYHTLHLLQQLEQTSFI